MNMFANLTTDSSIADEKDSVGGGSGPLPSGLYPMTVAMAHITVSPGGATGLALSLKTEDNKEVRQTLWMTSGTAKGGKNYYEKDGVKNYLPGFLLANSLCQLTIGKEITETDIQDKVINLYSFDAKAEVPTKVQVVMDLLNQPILVGMIKQTVDKNVKNDAGVYVPSGETREENEIDKLFHAENRLTTAEIKAKAEEASFVNTWSAKHTGVTRNKAKGAVIGGIVGAPRLAGAAGAPTVAKPKSSLFA